MYKCLSSNIKNICNFKWLRGDVRCFGTCSVIKLKVKVVEEVQLSFILEFIDFYVVEILLGFIVSTFVIKSLSLINLSKFYGAFSWVELVK